MRGRKSDCTVSRAWPHRMLRDAYAAFSGDDDKKINDCELRNKAM